MGLIALPPFMPYIIAQAEDMSRVRRLSVECVAEEGCPVSITSARDELDLDLFGAPLASRLYIDYKNVSDRTITGAKFRIRYTDASGKDRGTYHAPQAVMVNPGSSSSEKWRHERVDPRTTETKIRVLFVKFADGSTWQSTKSGQIATPPQQEESGSEMDK